MYSCYQIYNYATVKHKKLFLYLVKIKCMYYNNINLLIFNMA